MAENKYKQLFQEISLQKEPRNGEGAPGIKVRVNGRFAFFFNLGEVSSMFAWLWKQSSRNEILM